MTETKPWAEMSPRERDALVATEVMGWIVNRSDSRHWHTVGADGVPNPHRQIGNRCCAAQPFNPTQDIAAAWEVVEKVLPDTHEFALVTDSYGDRFVYRASFREIDMEAGENDYGIAPVFTEPPECDHPAEAICRAALLLRGYDG